MNHTQFFQAIQKGQIPPVCLLEGPEEYIKQSALERLEKALLPPGLEALNETILENPEADAVIAAAETLPFMAERRLVVVKESGLLSGKMKDEAEHSGRLCDYLAQLPPTACLVFYVRGKADGRKKLYTALKKQGAIVAFDTLGESELNRWIIQTVKGEGKRITPENASLLAFTVGRDTALLKSEIEKLAAHAGATEEVTAADIGQVAVKSVECTVFEMVDALVAGQEAQAFTLLENMLRTGAERIGVLAMILRQYRMLFHLKAMAEERIPANQAASALGIPPFAVSRSQRQAQGYTLEELRRAVALCIETDFKLKSGKLSQEGAVEQVMLTLMAGKRGRMG